MDDRARAPRVPAGYEHSGPPNLNPGALDRLLAAGINDWGGVSPVTPDHVNPEAPWPHLATLRRVTEAAGKELVARLPIYPRFVQQAEVWLAPELRAPCSTMLMARAMRARMAGSPARSRSRAAIALAAPAVPARGELQASCAGPGMDAAWRKPTWCGCSWPAAARPKPCAATPTSCAAR